MADKKYYVVEWEKDGMIHACSTWFTASDLSSKKKIANALGYDIHDSLCNTQWPSGPKITRQTSDLSRLHKELQGLKELEELTTLASLDISVRQVVVSTPTSLVEKVEDVFDDVKESFFKDAKEDVLKAIKLVETIEVKKSASTALEDIPTDQLIEELYRRKGDK